MGQVLHGSARTTEAIRRAIQHGQENLRALAQHHSINQKTVAKWRNRTSVADLPTGPAAPAPVRRLPASGRSREAAGAGDQMINVLLVDRAGE